MTKKPLLAVTMGDAAGVGPEVIVRAWGDRRVHEACQPIVLGHPEVIRSAVRLVGSGQPVETSSAAVGDPEVIACLPVGADDVMEVEASEVDRRTGQAAYDVVVRAAQGALAGEFQGLVTAPFEQSCSARRGPLLSRAHRTASRAVRRGTISP